MFKNNLSIGARMAITAILAASVLLAAAFAVSAVVTLRGQHARADGELRGGAARVADAISSAQRSLQRLADNQHRLFVGLMPGNDWTLAPAADGGKQPVLSLGKTPYNGNTAQVDRFAEITGGVATVFAATGDDFVRVTTSVKKEDGSRAVGTFLGKQHPAHALLMSGQDYSGRATLFGKPYMTRYEPIKSGNKVIGVLFVGVLIGDDLAALSKLMNSTRVLDTGKVYAVNLKPGAEYGSLFGLDPMPAGGKADPAVPAVKAFLDRLQALPAAGGSFESNWAMHELKQHDDSQSYFAVVEPSWNWAVVAEVDGDEIAALSREILAPMVVSLLVALAAMAAVIVWIAHRAVTRPIGELQDALVPFASGDLSRVFQSDRRDEIGVLVRKMEEARVKLSGAIDTVRVGTDSINTASREIATGNADLSARTEQQASNLQQTAASMEQMTAAVKQSADTAQQASSLAAGATAVAEKGGAVVDKVVSTMDQITASSKRIADITGVIDSIAFQTNILALNAAVEAARAGEQGRGFAVVASEVRNLAQRSAQAAREIKSLIQESVGEVQTGSQLANEAGATMTAIVAQVKQVTELIGHITNSTLEQSDGIGQVNQAVTQLDQMTQQNSALVEQSAAAAASMREQADRLQQAVAVFKVSQGASTATALA
jgi:methyl-accepting chemotaxis protein